MPFMPAITADVTDAAAGTNTSTGITFPVASGRMYWFEFHLLFTISDVADGPQFILDTPAITTAAWTTRLPSSTTADTILHSNTDSAEASVTSSAITGGNYATVRGFIRPSAAGECLMYMDSEGAADLVLKAGSFVEYRDLAA